MGTNIFAANHPAFRLVKTVMKNNFHGKRDSISYNKSRIMTMITINNDDNFKFYQQIPMMATISWTGNNDNRNDHNDKKLHL